MSIFGVILVHIFPAFSRIQTKYAVNTLASSLENAEYSLEFLSISDCKVAHITQFMIFVIANTKSFLDSSDYTKSIPKYLFYKSIWMKQSDIILQFGLWLFFLAKIDKTERKTILRLTIINDRKAHEICFLKRKVWSKSKNKSLLFTEHF